MGLRGPKPLPAEIKQRRGTLRPDREQRVALSVPVERLPAPAHLSDVQTAIWDEQVGMLADVGVLRKIDVYALEAVVISIDGWRKCLEIIEDEGWVIDNTITGGFSQRQAHPLISTMRGFQADYYKWCAKYGLTASDRTALGMQEIKAKKMFAQARAELAGDPKPLRVVEGGGEEAEVVDAEVVED